MVVRKIQRRGNGGSTVTATLSTTSSASSRPGPRQMRQSAPRRAEEGRMSGQQKKKKLGRPAVNARGRRAASSSSVVDHSSSSFSGKSSDNSLVHRGENLYSEIPARARGKGMWKYWNVEDMLALYTYLSRIPRRDRSELQKKTYLEVSMALRAKEGWPSGNVASSANVRNIDAKTSKRRSGIPQFMTRR